MRTAPQTPTITLIGSPSEAGSEGPFGYRVADLCKHG